ncbi:hypothetical protein LCGC14_2897150 [marine sediment metagenome]|uniref:Serine protease n=1 Tax=marine sediment metagenome TaxID=412755 RepID=A0A0F8XVH7_9ZZZZ
MRLWPIITALLLILAGCGFARQASQPPELHTGLVVLTTYRGSCTAVNLRNLGLQMIAATARHCIIPGQTVDVQSLGGLDYGVAVVIAVHGDSALIQYTPAHKLDFYETTSAPPPGSDVWLIGSSRMTAPDTRPLAFTPLFSYGKYIGRWYDPEEPSLAAFYISAQPGFSGSPIFYNGKVFAITVSIVTPFPHSPWTYGVLLDELLKRPVMLRRPVSSLLGA